MRDAADALARAAGDKKGAAADDAREVSGQLKRLADADPALRDKAQAPLVPPLVFDLDQLRKGLAPQALTIKTLPPNLIRDWMLPDGRARVQALPKGDPNDTGVLRNFATAVLRAEPSATGAGVSYYESGKTVTEAFIEAGILALVAISALLLIALRRWTDVLLTLVPLLLAGAVTLEICVLIDLPLNFANIVALPLLLGVGVAFKIYYVTAWRSGRTNLLQSSLTRAIFFSALTTATAFGSLWLSSHPGTASMGKLLALSLVTTLAAVLLFQPALMGKPRDVRD